MRDKRFCTTELRSPESLERWFDASPGRLLLNAEKDFLDEIGRELFGYYLLQVGCLRFGEDLLCQSQARHHVRLSPGEFSRFVPGRVGGDPAALPIKSDTIDNVVLPHTLDFSGDPHQVLREVERILIPEGRVVILGFNPWGVWGAWRWLRIRRKAIPWCGHFVSMHRLTDWLTLLGFVVEQSRSILFRPPLQSRSLMNSLQPLERFGARYWPVLSAAYGIVAVKRVSALSSVGPAWGLRTRVLGGHAIEPTTRSGYSG